MTVCVSLCFPCVPPRYHSQSASWNNHPYITRVGDQDRGGEPRGDKKARRLRKHRPLLRKASDTDSLPGGSSLRSVTGHRRPSRISVEGGHIINARHRGSRRLSVNVTGAGGRGSLTMGRPGNSGIRESSEEGLAGAGMVSKGATKGHTNSVCVTCRQASEQGWTVLLLGMVKCGILL